MRERKEQVSSSENQPGERLRIPGEEKTEKDGQSRVKGHGERAKLTLDQTSEDEAQCFRKKVLCEQ